jgi:hypothetical protein
MGDGLIVDGRTDGRTRGAGSPEREGAGGVLAIRGELLAARHDEWKKDGEADVVGWAWAHIVESYGPSPSPPEHAGCERLRITIKD